MAALTFAPLQLAPTVVLGLMYGVRARTLRDRGAPVPGWRQWCWYSGLGLIAATLVSPLATLSDELFLAHMAEHLVIADLGALLLVLGLTGPMLGRPGAGPLVAAALGALLLVRGRGGRLRRPLVRARGPAWVRWLAPPVAPLPVGGVIFSVWPLPALSRGGVFNASVPALQP